MLDLYMALSEGLDEGVIAYICREVIIAKRSVSAWMSIFLALICTLTFNRRLSPTLAAQSLRGLEYVHALPALHRDIKGGNILLTSDGQVRPVDSMTLLEKGGGGWLKRMIRHGATERAGWGGGG